VTLNRYSSRRVFWNRFCFRDDGELCRRDSAIENITSFMRIVESPQMAAKVARVEIIDHLSNTQNHYSINLEFCSLRTIARCQIDRLLRHYVSDYIVMSPREIFQKLIYFCRWKNEFNHKNIKWVMLVSGTLTATTFYGLFAPQSALESMFGSSFSGSLEYIIIRSWSALVGLIGVVLIYGSFSKKHRVFSICIAAFSKIIFVSLMLIYGQTFLSKAAPAIIMDCAVIVLGVIFLATVRAQRSAT
jgi:hypothetical protein